MRRRKGALAQSMTLWVEGLAASVQGVGQRAHSAAAAGRAGSAGGVCGLTASIFSAKQEARSALRMRMACCLLRVLVLYWKCEAEALPWGRVVTACAVKTHTHPWAPPLSF